MLEKIIFSSIILVSISQASNYDKKYIDSCLNNIGNDVKTKNWMSSTFASTECGITMYGKGISLNIKFNAFDALKTKYKHYILEQLNSIAKKYHFRTYSILISFNEKKLMIDDEIESHKIH